MTLNLWIVLVCYGIFPDAFGRPAGEAPFDTDGKIDTFPAARQTRASNRSKRYEVLDRYGASMYDHGPPPWEFPLPLDYATGRFEDDRGLRNLYSQDNDLFQSDILLSDEQNRSISVFNVVPQARLWRKIPGYTHVRVCYEIAKKGWPYGSAPAGIYDGIYAVQDNLQGCINLKDDPTYCDGIEGIDYHNILRIIPADQCYSTVGSLKPTGVYQDIGVAEHCSSYRSVVHLLLHALGLYHEHSRIDQNKFIEFNDDNVIPSKLAEMKQEIDSDAHGMKYNWHSIMHPPHNWYSENGKDTIVYTPAWDEHCQKTSGKPCWPIGTFLDWRTFIYTDFRKLKRAYQCT